MRRARGRERVALGAAWALAVATVGCAASSPRDPERGEPSARTSASIAPPPLAPASASAAAASTAPGPSLSVLPRDFDFSKNPALVGRIAETAHHYYRFINPRFDSLVCRRYADWLKTDPRVALHGDAHVEQFGVTDLGRGLTDLDDTALGPRLVDLLRMGTSLVLVVEEKSASDAAFRDTDARMIDALARGYAEGLGSPDAPPPPSPLDERLEKTFATDRAPFLDESERSMLPFASPADEAEAKKLHAAYEAEMLRANMTGPKNKDFPAGTFALKKMGPIAAGIGSALDRRILMRLEGRTSKPGDDLIVEIKNERSPEAPTCLTPERDYRASRYLIGKARARPFDPIEIRGTGYWAGEWNVNHKIVKVDKTIASPADLEAVAFESGYVLGRGHLLSRVDGSARPSVLAAVAGGEPPLPSRAAFVSDAARVLALDEPTRARLLEVSRALAGEVDDAWARFRDAASRP